MLYTIKEYICVFTHLKDMIVHIGDTLSEEHQYGDWALLCES